MGFCVFRRLFLALCISAVPVSSAGAQVLIGYTPAQVRKQQQAYQKAQEPHYNTAQNNTAQSVPLYQAPPAAVVQASPSPQPVQPKQNKAPPVDFQADQLDYDETTKIITATGNVFLTQENRIVRADKVVYDLSKDTVSAHGHVVLNEPNGDIHYADQLVLRDQFKDGVVNHLTSVLNDGSRFTSKTGQRINGTKTVMSGASYTACEPCKDNPDKAPAWQIKASEVIHDKDDSRISYKHARFETYGVPVMYVPYFSHPDGSVERKTGLLAPTAGYKSDQGLMIENRFYWDIAPEQDATIGLMAFSKENPLLYTQWRKRWQDAAVVINGGVTYSGYTDSESGVERVQDDELRGHVLANALWNINDKWRSGADIRWASDDQYMNQYDFANEDILVSDLYAERFDNRDYAAVHFLTFQDTRILEENVDQPEVIPEIVSQFKGDPGAVPLIGGNWFANAGYLGLRRSGDDEQDMDRISLGGGWKRHLVSDYGLVTDVTLAAKQDIYHVRDLESATAGSGQRTEASEVRFFPQAHLVTSYPLVNDLGGYQARVEPLVAVTGAPNIDVTDKIPNEDSQDVQLDADNVFNADRFPGIDRVEDQSRLTYGLKSGLYFAGQGEIRTFFGQSYRFQDDNNPFPEGSGLSNRSSDVVGSIESNFNAFDLDYRFQLDSRHLSSNRHEVDAATNFGRTTLSSQYLFAKSLEGTEFDESREQIKFDAGYYLSEEWRTRAGLVKDFGENQGLRKAYLGLQYFGQCVSWTLTGERNYTDDSSGESDLEVIFRLGLKNLGEFKRSNWHNQSGTTQ